MAMKPKPVAPASSVQDWLLRVLCAAALVWLASYVDSSLTSNYGKSVFWETWATPGGAGVIWLPVISFALITGIVAGLIIGWVFPQHVAIKVAGIAAVLQIVAGILSGTTAAGIVLAAGMLLGALPSRTR